LDLLEGLMEAIKSRGGKIYMVGGPVRDRFLGISDFKDIDYLVCGVPIDDLKNILCRFGTINLVGQFFGVIKFKPFKSELTYDISLPRKEHSTGTGHRDFEVDFDHNIPIEDDLSRRDFTINAMAREFPAGALIDPNDGKTDLENRVLRMVSESSFTDDPLRMMRGVQFAARFNLSIEENTFKAMQQYADLVESVSTERIAEELNKLLERAEKPSVGFRLMKQTGLLKHILPELADTVDVSQPGGYHRWDVFEHSIRTVDAAPLDLKVRLAALFHDIGKPATKQLVENGATFYGHDKLSREMTEKALKRLRYSNEIIKHVCTLIDKHMFSENAGDKGVRRLINRVGTDLIFDLISLRKADTIAQGMGQDTGSIDDFRCKVETELSGRNAFGFKDLAVNGDDLKERFNLPEGPVIGEVLSYLLDCVLDEPEYNTKEKLLKLTDDFLHKRSLDI